ncbi:hypothetical protein, partial [Acinetobacter baumannii]|uniref:hypothetical protein n=1 Tax=Acinetobacter baumannii TaxID=470 RepID=UPI00115F7FBE
MGRTRDAAGSSRGQRTTTSVNPNTRPITKKWDSIDTKCLAALSSVEVHPTRFGCRDGLSHLGLLEDVETLFQTLGLGKVW